MEAALIGGAAGLGSAYMQYRANDATNKANSPASNFISASANLSGSVFVRLAKISMVLTCAVVAS